MVKFTILLVRKLGLTQAQFVEHHKAVHAPLFMSIAVVKGTVRRYVQQHAISAELPGLPPGKFEGNTELWFDDIESIGTVLFCRQGGHQETRGGGQPG